MPEAEFLEKFNDLEYKQVAKTELPKLNVCISTVWLGIDHNFDDGPPLIFETLIFGGPLDDSCWRYATEDEAWEGHQAAVEQAKKAGAR